MSETLRDAIADVVVEAMRDGEDAGRSGAFHKRGAFDYADAILALPAPPQDTGERERVLEKLDRAYAMVSAVSQGRQRWTMSVPARPDSDPDLVICDALDAARKALAPAPAPPAVEAQREPECEKCGGDRFVNLDTGAHQPCPRCAPATGGEREVEIDDGLCPLCESVIGPDTAARLEAAGHDCSRALATPKEQSHE